MSSKKMVMENGIPIQEPLSVLLLLQNLLVDVKLVMIYIMMDIFIPDVQRKDMYRQVEIQINI